MNIQKFTRETATKAHNGTILASAFIPQGMPAPFGAAWGYLENNSMMEIHSHPTAELYVVIKGSGVVRVNDEQRPVSVGDVIEIPPNAPHTMSCLDGGPFLWAALWWDVK